MQIKNFLKVLVGPEAGGKKVCSSFSLKLWVLEQNGAKFCKALPNGHIQRFVVCWFKTSILMFVCLFVCSVHINMHSRSS